MEDNVIARQQNSANIKIEEIKSGVWGVCVVGGSCVCTWR